MPVPSQKPRVGQASVPVPPGRTGDDADAVLSLVWICLPLYFPQFAFPTWFSSWDGSRAHLCDPLGALQASPSQEAHSCLWLLALIAGGVNALLPRSSLSLSDLATELSVAVGDSPDREQGPGGL